jgi:hypothetical protein
MFCNPVPQNAPTPGIWNPLPNFETVRQNGQLGNVVSLKRYYAAAGKLPSVSGSIRPARSASNPPALVSAGEKYVTNLVNAAMRGPEWKSTAIFLSWTTEAASATTSCRRTWTRTATACAFRDRHQPVREEGCHRPTGAQLDAYAKFIEDDFLHAQRLDPSTDGRPDPRPTVRNFKQKARNPLVLQPAPSHQRRAVLPHPVGLCGEGDELVGTGLGIDVPIVQVWIVPWSSGEPSASGSNAGAIGSPGTPLMPPPRDEVGLEAERLSAELVAGYAQRGVQMAVGALVDCGRCRSTSMSACGARATSRSSSGLVTRRRRVPIAGPTTSRSSSRCSRRTGRKRSRTSARRRPEAGAAAAPAAARTDVRRRS